MAVKELISKFPTLCQVLRDGRLISLEIRYLVPGDIVEIDEGNLVPADVRIIESRDMKIDKSMYMKEDGLQLVTVEPNRSRNILESTNVALFGCLCKEGSGKGVVI